MRWSEIRFLGNSKLVQQNYIWIFLVPVIVKLSIYPEKSLQLIDSEYILNLPFSWYLLYFAALSFAIGLSIYLIRCPKIVKSYDDFSKFKEHGNNFNQLNLFFNNVSQLSSNNLKGITQWLESISQETKPEDIDNNLTTCIELNKSSKAFNIKNDYQCDSFWEIYNLAEISNHKSLILATFFYGIGFAILLGILVKNLIFVLTQIL
ncbi:hypothetical protein DXX93_12295 [Thalassotalea euphylliae]|uniref:Uncharacterized protein n=1 Tax=Thalassotalea euphylliae TaxID=1655234 RepID=A0A3E0TSB2_9GAMM|nr:hypothetical protein [Thalassotalea euphylliae]REL27270.1 hypothetical protein DXX93_12295 [Thalassotalea euphylliae]